MQELTLFLSQHLLLSGATAIVLILVLLVEVLKLRQKSVNLTPTQATQLINHANALVIDIRPSEQYRKGHIIDSECLSLQELQQGNKKLEKLKSRPLIILCPTGTESQKLAAQLLKQGYNAHALGGGIRAWTNAQMPLVKD